MMYNKATFPKKCDNRLDIENYNIISRSENSQKSITSNVMKHRINLRLILL